MRRASFLALVLAAVAAGCGNGEAKRITVELSEREGSGRSGTATFVETGEGATRVELELEGEALTVSSAALRPGGCEELRPLEYPLEDIIDRSTTEVPVALETLRRRTYAVTVSPGPTEPAQVSACGELSAAGAEPRVVTVELAEQNDLKQPGQAWLEERDGRTAIGIRVATPPPGPQDAAVHGGTCTDLGNARHELSNVVFGDSFTVLNAPLEELRGQALVVFGVIEFEDGQPLARSAACGAIPG